MSVGFTIFDTAIGRCGLAWGPGGITSLVLPGAQELSTRERLVSRLPGVREARPPAEIQRALEAITALLRGERTDLTALPLDLSAVPPFHRAVYQAARTIGPGATISYGELAARAGKPGAARAVGQAMGKNPFALIVPCHRVLAAGGKVGGFSAEGGISTKLRLLELERGTPRLGFDPDLALETLGASDPGLRRLIAAVGPFTMQIEGAPTVFLALARAIVYQQLTGKAAATIYGRLCALFPRSKPGPSAEQIFRAPEEKLLGAGLSRGKMLALKDLSRRVRAGEIPSFAELEAMDDEAIIERLITVRGIGRWTVEMLLIFRLGRPDILPADDYGVRKGFAHAFKKKELPTRAELAERGLRWRPYRTVASWYLWRAAERAPRG